jgi:hypothetical protein
VVMPISGKTSVVMLLSCRRPLAPHTRHFAEVDSKLHVRYISKGTSTHTNECSER